MDGGGGHGEGWFGYWGRQRGVKTDIVLLVSRDVGAGLVDRLLLTQSGCWMMKQTWLWCGVTTGPGAGVRVLTQHPVQSSLNLHLRIILQN